MSGWTFADVWEANAQAVPDRIALVHGDLRLSWAEMDRRANGVAHTLLEAGVREQDKVAQYLYNCAEFMESQFAILKAGLVPVNTNYRYAKDELIYLWNNADAVAVVFHGSFTATIEDILSDVPDVQLWLWVDDGTGDCPTWAAPYDRAAASNPEPVSPPWGRDSDQLYMLYTGGTTGMPKGVMWPQGQLLELHRSSNQNFPAEADYEFVSRAAAAGKGRVGVPCAPLMHGTGAFTAHSLLHHAGTVVTLTNRSFDADELLETVEREGVQHLGIVGDAFAKPILSSLEANPGERDISTLETVVSSGVMWSEETKQGLLGHNGTMLLVDAFSSSEALGMGTSTSTGSGTAKTAQFSIGERAIVIDDDNVPIQPGSGLMGRVAVRGILPVGYYKDPEKTAKTFIEINGERYSTPGDYATVEPDGSLTLLGRGSVCINTGGEKVFPEEVEEALKRHASVLDAVVVGIPDDKFGEAVTGVVQLLEDQDVDTSELISHVKSELAHYKAPKRVFCISSVNRAANGKVDYSAIREFAINQD